MTPAAQAAIEDATDIFGYKSYVERLDLRPGQRLHASDNRVELQRAGAALAAAEAGSRAVLVSGGDPGVFAMAAAVFEAIERGPAAWRSLDVVVDRASPRCWRRPRALARRSATIFAPYRCRITSSPGA